MTDNQPRYPRPEELKEFRILVDFAKSFQRSQITLEQYLLLERAFLSAHLPRRSDPLFGWYYAGRYRLKEAITAQGVSISA